MWLKIVVIVALVLAAGLTGLWIYGSRRWKAGTRELRARLESSRVPVRPLTVDFRELDGLPPPVQRYLRKVLRNGQPMIAGVRLRNTGTLNMGDAADRWKPFTANQRVVTLRPGFDWDASIAMAPGLPARVHDAYVAGEGMLHAALFGLFSVANLRGTGDVAQGELMRFFAEAAWYPTALMPSQGVRWEEVDDRSARGTLTDGPVSVTLLFTFDEHDLADSVQAEARGRVVGGKSIPTPWQGRVWNYQERDGMQIPLDSEVAWLLAEGAKPYWRGRITEITYEFAR